MVRFLYRFVLFLPVLVAFGAMSFGTASARDDFPRFKVIQSIGLDTVAPYDFGIISDVRLGVRAATSGLPSPRSHAHGPALRDEGTGIGAAIRPTSIAGWRSGRTRHLASG